MSKETPLSSSSAGSSRVNSRQGSTAHIPIQTGLSNPKDPLKQPKQIQQSVQGFEPIPKKSAIIKTDKPRPHVCTTCTRAFARYEHLKRHERSHTNEKPFQCAQCGRCFARRDLVLRHQQKLHGGTGKETVKGSIITNYGNKEVSLPTANSHLIVNDYVFKRGRKNSAKPQDGPPSVETTSSIDTQGSLFPAEHSLTTYQPKRPRHNSFSASSAFSYTKDGSKLPPVPEPEGPHQVGFATPQFAAKEVPMTSDGSVDLGSLGLGFDIDEFSLDPQQPTPHQNEHYGQAQTPRFDFMTSEYLYTGGSHGFTPKEDFNPFLPATTSNKRPRGHNNSIVGTPVNPLDITSNSSTAPSSSAATADSNGTGSTIPTDNGSAGVDSLMGESSPEDWLEEFIRTPFDANFGGVRNLNGIGFGGVSPPNNSNNNKSNSQSQSQSANIDTANLMASHQSPAAVLPSSVSPSNEFSPSGSVPGRTPTVRQHSISSASPSSVTSSNGIPSLFRSRQVDLFHKEVETDQSDLKLFSHELREQILKSNGLGDSQLPSLDELNKYVYLFKTEFDKYFPFIHLETLVPSIENYPLLLSVGAVGALYGFHSTHAMLMFNIARFRIHEFLEREKKHFKTDMHQASKDAYSSRANSVPIWVYQSMVLLIFIGIFNNDLSVTQTMAMFLNSLIELVKITALNHPLENFLTPPPVLSEVGIVSEEIQRQNFNYFVLAQTRIRTCHTILLVSNLFTTLIGLDCSLHSIDLKCGIHCKWEELWQSADYQQWYRVLDERRYTIDSKFALVELSNGSDSYTNCLSYLTLNNFILNDDEQLNKKFQMKTLLSLLLSIHEKISLERVALKNETNGVIAATKWRMNARPVIESLIKSWESLYIKNGGVFYLNNEQSLQAIYTRTPVLRLILPLLSLAKIRKCVDLTSIIEKIWQKDWAGMNGKLQKLRDDPEALKDATNYALDIVKLWIDYVSIHQDAEKTSLRTPIFFITCIFTSLLIIAEFLLSIEKNAANVNQLNYGFLNANERTLWLKTEMVFKKIENCLMLNENNKTYAEFLRVEAKGALDVKPLDDDLAKRAVNPNTDIIETARVIQSARLSSRSLYLGVRILADAPIWPIALLFAQALKARAVSTSKSQPNSPLEAVPAPVH